MSLYLGLNILSDIIFFWASGIALNWASSRSYRSFPVSSAVFPYCRRAPYSATYQPATGMRYDMRFLSPPTDGSPGISRSKWARASRDIFAVRSGPSPGARIRDAPSTVALKSFMSRSFWAR